MARLNQIVLVVLLLAPLSLCDAKGWFNWLYREEETHVKKKKRLSVIPGILRDQIESMEQDLEHFSDGSDESEQLKFRIDQRQRQLQNIKLIARGMSLDEFDNFVRLDDELALLRIKLRPKANNIADLTGDSDYKRMVELRDQLDTKRKIYGMDTRRGQQPAHIVENFHKRHMSATVVHRVKILRDKIDVEKDPEKIKAMREELDDLYNRHKSRKQPTEEELAAIKEEDHTLQAELEMTNEYLAAAHANDSEEGVHLGRVRMKEISDILERDLMTRVLMLRKERDLKLRAERFEEAKRYMASKKAP